MPSAWSHSNPVDILGDADAERYAKAVNILMKDPASDGLLVILSPQDMTDATATAIKIKQLAQNNDKPLLASWMGAEAVREGTEILSHAQIPVFEYPDDAAKTFAIMWRYSQNLKTLYEFPAIDQSAREEERFAISGKLHDAKQIIQEGSKRRKDFTHRI